MTETVHIGPYFVAIIDIVGQRDKLKAWASPPNNKAELERLASDVIETAGYVKELRSQFDQLYAAAKQPTGLLDHLDPEKRAWVEGRKQTNLWRRGFSDSYVMTVPCWYEQAWGLHAADIYYSLLGICGLFIWSLAMEKPFRGGVDVGLGIEIDTQEVYGPVTVQAYELESRKAKCPRIMVGEGLLSYLDDLEQKCASDPDGRHTRLNIQNSRGLITRPRGGKPMLDVMGNGVHSVLNHELFGQMVEAGYSFVVREQKRFYQSGPKKLYHRYSQLREYCESRLQVWGVNPVQE